MKKQTILTSLDDSTSWEEHPALKWILDNRRYLSWGLLAVVTVLIALYRIQTTSSKQEEANYLTAEKEFHQFATSAEPTIADSSFEKLKQILKQHPELYQKYDGLIAQALINKGRGDEASEYAARVIARTKNEDDPLYANYSLISVSIAQNRLKEALDSSLALQKQLEKTPEDYLVLTAYNLLRIASLKEQLGLRSEEKQTWKKWRDFVSDKNDETLEKVIDSYGVEGISLANYIEMREKQ